MSNSSLEPTDVGPLAGGNLRASDADREKVTTLLSAAYAEGRITREEHDERLEHVLSAKTFDDLVPITQDLVPAPSATVPLPARTDPNATYALDTTNPNPEVENLLAIFGSASRKGKWRVRKDTKAFALFGGIDLDLRDAIFEAPVVEISGAWCFGGLDIKAPAGIQVRDQTVGIFGGTDVSDLGDPQPGAPVLVVKGVSLFGGVSIKGPKPDKKKKARNHSWH